MKVITAICIFLLASCNNKNTVPVVSEHVAGREEFQQEASDSLDLSNLPYNTTNFPDAVRKTLHQTDDSLWQIVYKSLLPNPSKAIFPNKIFIEILRTNDFKIDTVNDKLIAHKNLFNQKENIQFDLPRADTIIVINEKWFEGKKYILVTTMADEAYRKAQSYQ
jgi:hypothetical protein